MIEKSLNRIDYFLAFVGMLTTLVVVANPCAAQDSKPPQPQTESKTAQSPPGKSENRADQDEISKTPQKNVTTQKLFWAFLVTGKPTTGVAREEIEKMQAEHLANFRRLADEGKLLTAGPMTDPDGLKRGIVVLKADNKNDLPEMFKPDPYVQQQYLKIVACEMKFELGQIRTKITPQGLEEYRIVLLQANADAKNEMTEELNEATIKYLKGKYTSKELSLSLKLFDAKQPCRQILIFKKAEDEAIIQKTVAEIPAVKDGVWTQSIMPLYMGKGSIDRIDE